MSESNIDFEPFWDYCLVKPEKVNVSKGGIALPTGAKLEELAKGLVLKAGPGAYRDTGTLVPNPINEGDTVYFRSNMRPEKVKINDVEYYCLSGRDVVARTSNKQV